MEHFDELHCICVLINSVTSRLNATFCYSIYELLTNLHRSVVNNITFCFTHTQNNDYQPGDALTLLTELLQKVKKRPNGVEIPISESTIYCVDNEPFKYLGAHHSNEQIPGKFSRFDYSWDKSQDEIGRLFKHISQLTPYKNKDLIMLNAARNCIHHLTKPMVDICENIETNLGIVAQHREKLEHCRKTKTKLEETLNLKVIKPKKLANHRTVCQNCKVEKIQISGEDKVRWAFKVCHDNCNLGVALDSAAQVSLKNCWAMEGAWKWKLLPTRFRSDDVTCSKCKHNWTHHMHETYEYTEIDKQAATRKKQEMDQNCTEDSNLTQEIKKVEDINRQSNRRKENDSRGQC